MERASILTIKILKSDFYKNEKLLKMKDVDINKIFVSKKESYGTKKMLLNISLDTLITMKLS